MRGSMLLAAMECEGFGDRFERLGQRRLVNFKRAETLSSALRTAVAAEGRAH